MSDKINCIVAIAWNCNEYKITMPCYSSELYVSTFSDILAFYKRNQSQTYFALMSFSHNFGCTSIKLVPDFVDIPVTLKLTLTLQIYI